MTTWSGAFAAQAASDLEAYDLLARSALPVSHRLHYLQMWLEKLCKAHVYESNIEGLKDTHSVIARILPRLVDEYWRRIGFARPSNAAEIRNLCLEIDRLHPSVKDNNRRPDNLEYPWQGSSGAVEVPAQWRFPLARRLDSNAGRLLLKAAIQLTQEPALFIRRG